MDARQTPWLMDEDEGRGLVGRARAGRSLKPARWPNGAKVAVALSFDSDHETIELRNGGRSPSRMSQGQYGARAGMGRILALLERHSVPATMFLPAVSATIHPDEARRVIDAGHEIGIHSWIHEFNSGLDAATERDLAFRASDRLEQITGRRPVGMRTASWDFSPHTLSVIRELGLIYDSSLMADDDPYELDDGGEPTGVVELPVEWIRDDAPYFNMDRMGSSRPYGDPRMVLDIFKREFDVARQEGGLFLLTLHPHHIGHRSRIFVLQELIEHALGAGEVWFATHEAVARHCLAEAGMEPRAPSA